MTTPHDSPPPGRTLLRPAAVLLLLLFPLAALAAVYPPNISDAKVEVYRSTAELDLKAWIFEPVGHEASQRRAAMVFFFGGGWNRGSPEQFKWQARYLASRGMVAVLADYRVRQRNGTLANIAVSDAKAAIRWMRENADRLGVDPDRIAAAGGSAGGHLAAATATLSGHDIPESEQATSARPNALVLFNPALITALVPGHSEGNFEKLENLKTRLGADPESMSPYHHVRPGLPPTIIFHGKADETVAYRTVELFTEKMVSAGNRCELVGYEGEGHGFFNHGRGDGSAYNDTMLRTDAFLVSLGWLEPKKTP
jgi:acetyl esterase/lipase